jgi:hypothetical protein
LYLTVCSLDLIGGNFSLLITAIFYLKKKMLIVSLILFTLFNLAAADTQFYITNPLNGTVWTAGRPANVTWVINGAAPQKVTCELVPASDITKGVVRVVAVLANNAAISSSTIIVKVPDNIPAWRYSVRD